jgi:plasmid stabilization system protein ParE
MKVAWSFVALGNLIETNKYISSENPEAARKVINDIYDTGNKIKKFPEKGRIVTEIRRKSIREVFCLEYRIIYRIESRRIFILTIRHMKQKLKKNDIQARTGV